MTIELIKGFAVCFAIVFAAATLVGVMMLADRRNPRRVDKHIKRMEADDRWD